MLLLIHWHDGGWMGSMIWMIMRHSAVADWASRRVGRCTKPASPFPLPSPKHSPL